MDNAPFDLFNAWAGLVPGSCTSVSADKKRAQIARGQALFNATNPGGRSCRGCHNAANNGTSVNNVLFNIGTADASRRTPDMPLYTLRNKVTLEVVQTTDPGKAFVTGLWNDIGRFKAPTLRGLSARGNYFHNGIARTLLDVVRHYEQALGFVFTPAEEADMVAFMSAL